MYSMAVVVCRIPAVLSSLPLPSLPPPSHPSTWPPFPFLPLSTPPTYLLWPFPLSFSSQLPSLFPSLSLTIFLILSLLSALAYIQGCELVVFESSDSVDSDYSIPSCNAYGRPPHFVCLSDCTKRSDWFISKQIVLSSSLSQKMRC